jgi:membrane fusion protein, multidrug efflux system
MSSNPTPPTSTAGTPPAAVSSLPATPSPSSAAPSPLPPPELGPSFLATAGKAMRELPPLAKAAIAVFLLLALVAWYVWAGRVSTDDAQVDAHITAVASQVSGYVVVLPIDDNRNVKKGEVLVQIDQREYQAEVDQAKASLALAEARDHHAQYGRGGSAE